MLTWSPALGGRSLLTLLDITNVEMLELIDLALALKARRQAGIRGRLLDRRQIALIFEKSSTRTRNAASVALCIAMAVRLSEQSPSFNVASTKVSPVSLVAAV